MLIGSLCDKSRGCFPDICNQESTIIDYLIIFIFITVLELDTLDLIASFMTYLDTTHFNYDLTPI